MSTNAILRRTIKALCAPAVLAMLASQAPVAQAAVIAGDGFYGYDGPSSSSSSSTVTTFSFHVLKNDGFFESGDPESPGQQGPLVQGAPRPLQLVSASVTDSDGSVNATVTPFRNCLMVTVASNQQTGTSGSSGSFTITYTVADATGQQDTGTLNFLDFGQNTFNGEEPGAACNDENFRGSVTLADSASTPANTPVEINVLENDTLGTPIVIDRPPVLTVAPVTGGEFPTATLTVDGRPDVRAPRTTQNGGSVQVNNDGTITYTPAFGFSGRDTFTYTIQDYDPENSLGFASLNPSALVTVDVGAPEVAPAVITVMDNVVPDGSNLAVADSDFVAGETVTFDGSATMFLGEGPRSFQWFVGDSRTPQGTDAMFTPRLPDGVSRVRLVVTQDFGEGESLSAISAITVTVAPADTGSQATILVNNAPVMNGAFALTDSDGKPGEQPTFDGSQSVLPGGPPTSFSWFVGDSDTPQGTGPTFSPQLPDGASVVRLSVSNGQFSADSAVNVTVGGVPTLANIPGLTANQRSVALALDNICTTLQQQLAAQQTLTADQDDLRQRCEGILAADASAQVRALDELGAQDFNGARLQTLLFTNSLYAGVQDRLMALRGGAKGLSLAGLNIFIDGKAVPLAQLQEMAGQLLGGGAAADEPGSLLGDKWGAWSRGNFTFGEKDRSRNDKGFEADQFSLTAGLDYRLTDKMVIGGALAYGSSNLDYNPSKEGGLDTQQWAVSIYGSSYAGKNFYVDAVVNAANSSYEADRRITYNDAFGTVQRQAKGDTDGFTLSGGLSGGYDIVLKGLTISPNLGVFYLDSTIDAFREKRSQGLNLVYDEQSFQSLTGTLGFRASYAWNLSWGVLIPYVRTDYVREFNQDVEAFNVHFANDPKSPANTIVVKADDPDQSYVRLVGGLSGQFPFGISGYIEYQRLQGFEFVNFNDLSMGLRMQYRY